MGHGMKLVIVIIKQNVDKVRLETDNGMTFMDILVFF